jgi:hypothetical protein
MATIHKTFCNGVGLTGTAQVLYTVPAGLKGTLEKITFCNNDTVASQRGVCLKQGA